MFRTNPGFIVMALAAASVGLLSMQDLYRQYFSLNFASPYGSTSFDYYHIHEVHKKNQRGKIQRRNRSQ